MRKVSLLSILLAMTGCGDAKSKIPEIGRDLPSEYAEGTKVFQERIKKKFPLGTEEKEIEDFLRNQGFLVKKYDAGGHASFNNKKFPVSSVWKVGWQSNGGRITNIWGGYGGVGP